MGETQGGAEKSGGKVGRQDLPKSLKAFKSLKIDDASTFP